MVEETERRRYWSEIGVLLGFFVVASGIVGAGVLLEILGPRWATEDLGTGPRSGPPALYLVLIGLFPLLIAVGGIVRRIVKGPTLPGRHSADSD